jgi:muconolactone delta-isomerase
VQFLTISRRKSESFSDAEFAAKAEDEYQRGRTLYAEGAIRQIWRRGDVPGACIVFEADSEEGVRKMVESLPFYRAGMLELVMVIPLHPYGGFGPR